jgi:hypothetical protein
MNDIFLITRGNQFIIYTNGTKVGTWFNGTLTEGGFSLGTGQDTGTSVCTFAYIWIWEFDQAA